MRILILEDDPLISMDLEDIVTRSGVECVLASTVDEALARIAEGVDFALLDFHLGRDDLNSLPVASYLQEQAVPFGFVSGSLREVPARFANVPRTSKPFRPSEIEALLPLPRAAAPVREDLIRGAGTGVGIPCPVFLAQIA